MLKKIISTFLILFILLISLTGCYDARGIDDLSFGIAIGLDLGESNALKLSIQFAKPNSSAETSSRLRRNFRI